MLSEWELWACANHFVNKLGADASIIAAIKVDELIECGELDGAKNFRAIIERIAQLLARPHGSLH